MVPETPPPPPEAGPPFFNSWSGAYVFVLGWLVVTVIAFAIITKVYT